MPQTTIKAASTWSLHRTLGSFRSGDGPGPMSHPSPADPGALELLELPAALAAHGFSAVQVCHFHLPLRDAAYLGDLRASLAEAGVALDALLIDDGDLSGPDAESDERWIDDWLEVAEALGAPRARIPAGRSAPTPALLAESARRLGALADRHPGVRVLTENWLDLLPTADDVLTLLDASDGRVGLLADLGNWTSDDRLDQLAAIAPRAESCHAKCHVDDRGPDAADYLATLGVLAAADYRGTLALVYDGPDADEWEGLEAEWALVQRVYEA